MLEIVLTSSESDQYSSAPKEISKFPLMYMTGYFCRSVYKQHNTIFSIARIQIHSTFHIVPRCQGEVKKPDYYQVVACSCVLEMLDMSFLHKIFHLSN